MAPTSTVYEKDAFSASRALLPGKRQWLQCSREMSPSFIDVPKAVHSYENHSTTHYMVSR